MNFSESLSHTYLLQQCFFFFFRDSPVLHLSKPLNFIRYLVAKETTFVFYISLANIELNAVITITRTTGLKRIRNRSGWPSVSYSTAWRQVLGPVDSGLLAVSTQHAPGFGFLLPLVSMIYRRNKELWLIWQLVSGGLWKELLLYLFLEGFYTIFGRIRTVSSSSNKTWSKSNFFVTIYLKIILRRTNDLRLVRLFLLQ